MRAAAIRDFRRAVGARIAHVTAAENLPFIKAHGLWSAHDLAAAMTVPANRLTLRKDRLILAEGGRRARLNHQRPILRGRAAADRIVDGHTAESWAAALDRRVYFWPERRIERFADSIQREQDIVVLWFDSERFADVLFDRIELAPINTGNFTQGGAHARRGDWIYVPLAQGLDAFRENRRRLLGTTSRDAVAEISLIAGVPAETLSDLLLEDQP